MRWALCSGDSRSVCDSSFWLGRSRELKPAVTSTMVTHLNFKSSKPFAAVTAALEKQLGKFDPEISKSFSSASNPAEIEAKIHAMEGSSGLMIFAVRDHGQLLSLKGKQALGRQYEVGNPLVALEMTQHDLVAGEYAPLTNLRLRRRRQSDAHRLRSPVQHLRQIQVQTDR